MTQLDLTALHKLVVIVLYKYILKKKGCVVMVLSLYIHKITHKHQLPISVLIYDDKCLFVVPEESRLLYFPVYIFFISSPSRHSQTESPTS